MPQFLLALEADGVRMGDLPKEELPLYCALFRFLRTGTPTQVLMETSGIIQQHGPVPLKSVARQTLECGVTVSWIEKTAALQKLHDAVCGVQLSRGADPLDAEKIGEGYSPYVIERDGRGLPVGTIYTSNFVTLYEKREKFGLLMAHSNIKLG